MNINVNNTDPRQMKITELKEYAKALGVKGFSKLKKQELLEAVLSAAPKAKGASDEKNEKPKPPAEKKITRPPAKTDGGERGREQDNVGSAGGFGGRLRLSPLG